MLNRFVVPFIELTNAKHWDSLLGFLHLRTERFGRKMALLNTSMIYRTEHADDLHDLRYLHVPFLEGTEGAPLGCRLAGTEDLVDLVRPVPCGPCGEKSWPFGDDHI